MVEIMNRIKSAFKTITSNDETEKSEDKSMPFSITGTEEKVAKKMKKSKLTINNWENGKTEIDYANLITLCKLYSVTIDDIVLPY